MNCLECADTKVSLISGRPCGFCTAAGACSIQDSMSAADLRLLMLENIYEKTRKVLSAESPTGKDVRDALKVIATWTAFALEQ